MPLSAAIISLQSESSEWVAASLEKYFDEVDDLDLREIEVSLAGATSQILYRGQKIKRYDCVYLKGSFRYAQVLETLAAVLEDGCYMPLRPRSFTLGHDKLLTQLALHEAGIPMPVTYIASTITGAKELMAKLNFPIILKFPHGTGGKGVLYADSLIVANGILDALSALRQPFLIQEYVPTGGVDVRAIVVGSKVVAAYKRVAALGDIRSNLHSGGTGDRVTLDASTKKICVKAARTIGAEIAGVDILQSHKGPLVIEVNLSPGLQGVTKHSQVNVADKVAQYLYEQTQQRQQAIKEHNVREVMKELHDDSGPQRIVAGLEFRGNRILLPEIVHRFSRFSENADYTFTIEPDSVTIEPFDPKDLEQP